MPPSYKEWQYFAGRVDDAKLHLRNAFGRFLLNIEKDFPPVFKSELVRIVQELCEPEPTRRGHPKERRGIPAQFSLKRYVSRFDFLLKRAELGLPAGVL
jgi:hypothetical protein